MEHPLVRQLSEREKAARELLRKLGREACGDTEHVIEIRANKRWLAKRQKELLAAQRSLYQEHELAAVKMALKALKTARGAASFRKRLKEFAITIVGGLSGGTGSATSGVYHVISMPRKKREPGGDERILAAFRKSAGDVMAKVGIGKTANDKESTTQVEKPFHRLFSQETASDDAEAWPNPIVLDIALFSETAEAAGRREDVLPRLLSGTGAVFHGPS